jgi:hypothetical protein
VPETAVDGLEPRASPQPKSGAALTVTRHMLRGMPYFSGELRRVPNCNKLSAHRAGHIAAVKPSLIARRPVLRRAAMPLIYRVTNAVRFQMMPLSASSAPCTGEASRLHYNQPQPGLCNTLISFGFSIDRPPVLPERYKSPLLSICPFGLFSAPGTA